MYSTAECKGIKGVDGSGSDGSAEVGSAMCEAAGGCGARVKSPATSVHTNLAYCA